MAAVDELTAAEAIEKIKIDLEPLAVRRRSAGEPAARRPERAGATETFGFAASASTEAGRQARRDAARSCTLKWTKEDFDAAERRPSADRQGDRRVAVGDVDAGLKNAALVLDETFVTPNTSHQCLETRTTMAYWQNGKVYVHTGTQSTAQTVPAIARWLGIDPSNVVFISEYTGGGFGSKITGDITLVIPALLSKKVQRAGDDAHYARRRTIHRPRASQPARTA